MVRTQTSFQRISWFVHRYKWCSVMWADCTESHWTKHHSLLPLCSANTLSEADDPSQWEIEETVRFEDLYDQDKDGKLNREEQLRWVAPNSYGSAREEVRRVSNLSWMCDSSLVAEFSCSCCSGVPRRFISSRKWITMVTDRSRRRKFWKIKTRSWTAKWQTTDDICIHHMMNYNNTLWFCCKHTPYFRVP